MVALSPRDELTPAKSPAPSQISLQSALMADRLQNVTKLELLNHYLDSGSITLINGNEEARGKAGKGLRPPHQSFLPRPLLTTTHGKGNPLSPKLESESPDLS